MSLTVLHLDDVACKTLLCCDPLFACRRKIKICPLGTSEVVQNLLQELPGRLWDGKEAMLSAVAAVSKAAPKAVMSSTQPTSNSKAVVDALMAALARKKQTYR